MHVRHIIGAGGRFTIRTPGGTCAGVRRFPLIHCESSADAVATAETDDGVSLLAFWL
jgi:hypothetical protein